jgi:NAD(P)-dependent dehydrogenase (short-subunit alcohol dehydrogenase family)
MELQLKDTIVPQQAVLAMAQELDKLDLAFNNAGGLADMKPIDQTTKKGLEWVIGLNPQPPSVETPAPSAIVFRCAALTLRWPKPSYV